MKRFLLPLATGIAFATQIQGQVWINEMLANPPGSDSTAGVGLEYFELRGTPGLSLAGYYLLSLEGQGTTGKGDVNQLFDLGSFSLGANGFLFARQLGSPYTSVNGGATLAANSVGQGWGQVNVGGSSVGHSSDGSQFDLENSATTIILLRNSGGVAPTITTDLDSDNDGVLDGLDSNWTILDSIGLMDGAGAAAGDVSYGAITFRVGTLGTAANGPVITVLDPVPGSQNLYVGRKGDSTGSTADDWVASYVTGTGGGFSFGANTTDLSFVGLPITVMQFGASNAPEPASWALLGAGFAAWALIRRRR